MIPKVIHYCWFGGKPLPPSAKRCIASWRKFCPNYEIKRWDESNFDVSCHPFIKTAYEAKAWAFVSDYARLRIIYEHGGIYFDTDVKLLRSPDFLLENPCYIGVQQRGRLCNTGLGFGASKGNPVVQQMLQKYDALTFVQEEKRKMTCPRLNMAVIEARGYHDSDAIVFLQDVTVYPMRYFDPISAGEYDNLLCKDTVSIHQGSMSWMSSGQQIKRQIICMIGIERIDRIKRGLKARIR